MNVRAKFNIGNITKYTVPAGSGSVVLNAVYANKNGTVCEENKSFSEATPSAQINMMISNPAAFKQFEEAFNGKRELYVDFSLAPE